MEGKTTKSLYSVMPTWLEKRTVNTFLSVIVLNVEMQLSEEGEVAIHGWPICVSPPLDQGSGSLSEATQTEQSLLFK